MRRLKQTLAVVLCVCTLLTTDSQVVTASGLAVTEDTAAYTEELGDKTDTIRNDTEELADKAETVTESNVELTGKTDRATPTDATAEISTATPTDTTTEISTATPTDTTMEISTENPTDTTTEISTESIAEATANAATEHTAAPTTETTNATQQPVTLDTYRLTYLVMESSEVSTPDSQYILVGINNEEKLIQTATLVYQNKTQGTAYTQTADVIQEDALLFYLNYPDSSYTGEYELTSIICETETGSQTIAIDYTGIDATYGVNRVVETTEDAQIVTDEEAKEIADTDGVVVSDATGAAISTDTLSEAVEQAKATATSDGSVAATGSSTGELVIVLDPGHGGGDPGACYYGLQEKNLNLAIALACKAELEKYAGVKVYMTRTGDARPGVDSQDSLTQRVNIAKKYKADILVSIHNDSAVGSGASGAKVFYPNVSYNSAISQEGNGAARQILEKLVQLGLKNDGIQIRNSACGDTYPDGSLADYYGLIRRGKYAGIPTLIIEHAFMTNYSDVVNHLSTPAQLTALGVADATGIAKYYNLFQGSAAVKLKSVAAASSTSVALSWSRNKKMDGYKIYRSTSKNGKYKLIKTIKSNKTTTYTNKKLKAGKTYYYKVSGYRDARIYSASNKLKAYTLKTVKLKSAVSVDSKKIELNWSKVSKASGYQIFRATEKNGTYTKIKTIKNVKTVSYTDQKVNSGQVYYYRVRAYNKQNNKKGYGSYSNKCYGIATAAPSTVTAVQQENSGIQLSWSKVDKAHEYEIYRAGVEGSYEKIATVDSKLTTYEDTNVIFGTTYSYRIRTVNYVNKHYGYSSYSDIATCIYQEVEDTQEDGSDLGKE